MATKYLNENAVAFNPAAWGGSEMAAGDDFVIELPFGKIVGGDLNQSGIVGGFESMTIKPGASGTIGGGPAGAFIADFDNSADAFISNRGSVSAHITAGGDSELIKNYDIGPGSQNIFYEGTFEVVTMNGGTLEVNASAILDEVYLMGGGATIEYHDTDASLIQITGGTHIIKRMPDLLEIGGNARVTLDPDDAEGFTDKVIEITGGTLVHRAGAVPTVIAKGGVIDYSNNRRAFTPGAISFVVTGSKIIESSEVSMANVTFAGALKRDIGGFTQLP